jgi:hypothetical protein
LYFFTKFRRSDEFLANFCENSRVVGVPGVVGFSAVAFIPALAGIFAVAVVPAVDGVFAVASFPAEPGVPMLL